MFICHDQEECEEKLVSTTDVSLQEILNAPTLSPADDPISAKVRSLFEKFEKCLHLQQDDNLYQAKVMLDEIEDDLRNMEQCQEVASLVSSVINVTVVFFEMYAPIYMQYV